jgi:hypothetical protein
MRGIRLAAVLLLLQLVQLHGAGSVTLSTHNVSFQAVQNGLMTFTTARVTVNPPGSSWSIVAGPGPAGMLDAARHGDTLELTLPTWWVPSQKPGVYRQAITVQPGEGGSAAAQQVQVSVTIAASSPDPKVSYPAGPQGCSAAPGLLSVPICTVPGERPPGDFLPPKPGSTYTDPNFGGKVTILTGPETLHGYSSPSAISPRSRYVAVFDTSGSRIVDLKKGSVVYPDTGAPPEGVIWDGRDENIMYSLGAPGRVTQIVKYDLKAHLVSVLADFSSKFKSISAGGTGEGSKDNWLPFFAPSEEQVCAYSIEGGKVYCADLKAIPGGPYKVDFPTMARGVDHTSGKRYLVVVGSPAMLLFSVDEKAGVLRLEMRGPERISFFAPAGNGDGVCDPGEACVGGSHSDLFEDSAGDQYMMVVQEFQSPCEVGLVSYRLNAGAKMGIPVELGGGMRLIMGLYRCGGKDAWVDLHIGCARSSPYCVVSTTYGGFQGTRAPDDKTPFVRTPFISEVFVVRDNGAEVRRLAENRSVQFTNELANGYWSTPRACISPDGAYVVYDSNFGFPNQRRVVQVATGF